MKIILRLILSVAVLSTMTITNPVYAFDERDCSIWLCAPMGFPAGCSDAKSAFKRRIRQFKPPLPPIHQCLVSSEVTNSEGELLARDGFGAYIPSKNSVVKNEKCMRNSTFTWPKGCTKTVNYIEVIIDGQLTGEPYYFDNSGNEVITK